MRRTFDAMCIKKREAADEDRYPGGNMKATSREPDC